MNSPMTTGEEESSVFMVPRAQPVLRWGKDHPSGGPAILHPGDVYRELAGTVYKFAGPIEWSFPPEAGIGSSSCLHEQVPSSQTLRS